MPINPSRLKGKYGEANVAASGPAVNVALALLGLTAAVVFLRITGKLPADNTPAKNAFDMLWLFTSLNVVLVVFNLLPAPPLDGSHILANLHRGYANLISRPQFQQVALLPFIVAFILIGQLITPIMAGTLEVISQLSGVGVEMVEG
jgi:Zn-dependent protease